MKLRSALDGLGGLVALAYVCGLVLGGMGLAWEVMFRGGWPSLNWWQWVLAPLAIGVVAMSAEAVFEVLRRATGFGAPDQSRGKRLAHLLILFAILATVIIGPAMYKVANP
jgi:hypothetical protein